MNTPLYSREISNFILELVPKGSCRYITDVELENLGNLDKSMYCFYRFLTSPLILTIIHLKFYQPIGPNIRILYSLIKITTS